jgi:hypothetical protein
MINEILSPPAFIALTAVLTTAAVSWAIHKSRAEKLEATQKANEFRVEVLEKEIERLSTVPPPPVVSPVSPLVVEPSDRTSIVPPTRREGVGYSLVHRDIPSEVPASLDQPFEYQGSIIPPPPASIRAALETLPGVGIAPKSSQVG